jgi:hypothetical protein
MISIKCKRTAEFLPYLLQKKNHKSHDLDREAKPNFANCCLYGVILEKSTARSLCFVVKPGFVLLDAGTAR